MNEHLRDLLPNPFAVDYQYHGHGPLDLYTEAEMFKYAELIIKDCVRQCESIADIAENINSGETARRTKATAQSCGNMIKIRFGIE